MPESIEELMTSPVFFIVGCPRSGTTLIQTILDSHPDIAIPPESHFFRYYSAAIKAEALGAFPWKDKRLVSELIQNVRIRSWGIPIDKRNLMENADNTAMLIHKLFSCYANRQGKKVWGDKTPQHAMHIEEILSIFPKAKIIHQIRDGRDVVESYQRAFIGPTHIALCAERWKTYINTVNQAQTRIPPDQFIKVRYEDLVRSPHDVQAQLLNFLNLPDKGPMDPTQSRAARIYSRLSYLHIHNQSNISDKRIALFKTMLKPQEIRQIENIAGPQLEQEGYELIFKEFGGTVTDAPIKAGIRIMDAVNRILRKIAFKNGRKQLINDWTEWIEKLKRKQIIEDIIRRSN